MYIAGQFIKNGGSVHWIDKETSFDPEYASIYGIDANDKNSFGYSQPEYAEEAFDTIVSLVDNATYDLIVVDSVPALGSQAEYEKTAEENSMATLARRLAQHFPRIITKLPKQKVTIIYVNQLRANIQGAMSYGNKTTGGNAMQFYSHVKMELKKKENIMTGKSDSEYVGKKIFIQATKNKTARPMLSGEFTLLPEGFSKEIDILNLGIKSGALKAGGAWISSTDPSLEFKAQGIENARKKLVAEPELFEKVKQVVVRALEPIVDTATGEILETLNEAV